MHPPPIISNHRLARLALWLVALIAWFACGCMGERQRRRYGHVSIEKLERAVRDLILIHAAHLLPPKKRRGRCHHVKRQHVSLRAVAGSWLRRRLHTEGDLIARAQRLLAVLRTYRALAAGVAHRRCNGLTRLWPIVPKPARTIPIASFTLPAPCAADTS